jgi:hypothetical protein
VGTVLSALPGQGALKFSGINPGIRYHAHGVTKMAGIRIFSFHRGRI